MPDPFLWNTGDPEPPPEPYRAVPADDSPAVPPPEPRPDRMALRKHCDYCGRRIRRQRRSVIFTTCRFDFHGDRRNCRAAARRFLAQDAACVVMPPYSSDGLETESYGAALAGFDFVTLPWWLRRVPDRWLDGLRRDVAVKVGGIVERRCALKAVGEEDPVLHHEGT